MPIGIAPNNDNLYNQECPISFRVIPKNGFILVSWRESTTKDLPWIFQIIHYSLSTQKATTIVSYTNTSPDTSKVPSINSISSDNRYVAFSLYPCWGCEALSKATLFVDLQTKSYKEIVASLPFTWGSNGSYTYKKLISRTCGQNEMGPCTVDSDTLPLETGSFY